MIENRNSQAYADVPIRVLSPNQVWDDRGCFFVRLAPTSRRIRGLVVHQDAFGRRIAIEGVRG